jgi:hypothetical protein
MIHNQFHGDLIGGYIYIGMINGVVWFNACNIELYKHRKKPWLYRLLAPIKMGGVKIMGMGLISRKLMTLGFHLNLA